jgi:hypothetical protein
MKYLILIIIIATLAASMFGQATFQSRIAKQDEPKEFELNYDKFKDQTTVETHVGFRIHKARMDSLKLYIAAQVKGQETKTADVFLFHFVPLYGGGWQFLRQHHLIFLVDGESIDCGDGRQDGEVQGRGVHEWVNFIIRSFPGPRD